VKTGYKASSSRPHVLGEGRKDTSYSIQGFLGLGNPGGGGKFYLMSIESSLHLKRQKGHAKMRT